MDEEPRGDYRILMGLGALTATALTPFLVFHVLRAEWFLAYLTGFLIVITVGAAAWFYFRPEQRSRIRMTVTGVILLANASVAFSLTTEPQNTVYWIYALIFINFYLLPSWWGTSINIAICGFALTMVYPEVSFEQFARLAGSVPLCIFFGLVFSRSIEQQRRALQYLASHDRLTGIGNRNALDSAFIEAAERLSRYGEKCTLLLLDLDHFKEINDNSGHLNGDLILLEFTHVISRRLRESDRFLRFGGDEFVVLLPHTSKSEAVHLAESLRVSVADHPFASGHPVTVSAGLSELKAGDSAESWLGRADSALYQSKQQGRNRVSFANSTAAPTGDTDNAASLIPFPRNAARRTKS